MSVNYNLHSLGWKAFQDLCLSVARDLWGQTVQGFCDTNDGGRDGAFYGQWKNLEGEVFSGSFLIQCKHTSHSQRQIKLSDLADERLKAEKLCAQGLADNYFLLTNYAITGTTELKIASVFKQIPRLQQFKIFGSEWLNQTIQESKRLRMMVPRLYGLGDLSQILDTRAYKQSQEILSSLGNELNKFVITESYRRAADALNDYAFVLLLGEPASGKSTIAAALSLGALDQWNAPTMKLPSAKDFVQHWNPNERQFIWIDDVFGATQLDHSSTFTWNSLAPHLDTAVQKGTKIVLTSRDYIYNQALPLIKHSSFPLIKSSQVIIEVEKLSKEEREQILYNHIRLGRQGRDFKKRIKKHLAGIATHRLFKPETARRLGNPAFTNKLTISEHSLNKFIENPAYFLEEIIDSLDGDCLSALALIFMSSGDFPAELSLDAEQRKVIELIGGTIAGTRRAFSILQGSFLNDVLHNEEWHWRYKHPTIRDAFGAYLMKDKSLLEILIKGMPISTLFAETTCGDVGILGAKIIVPTKFYEVIFDRLIEAKSKREINRYLAYRCGENFYLFILNKEPSFFDKYNIYAYFHACDELQVLSQLANFGLLDKEKRNYFADQVKKIALSTPDAGFIRYANGLLSSNEIEQLAKKLKNILLNEYQEIISQWESDCRLNDGNPNDFFEPLISTINDIKERNKNNANVIQKLDIILSKIDEQIAKMTVDNEFDDEEDRIRYSDAPKIEHSDSKSIFDDVDQ